jgi:hypothetical protein
VKAGILAAALTALPAKNAFAQNWKQRDGNPGETPPVQNDPLANYSKAAFVSYLNSIFQVQTVSGPVAVTLAKVDDMPAPAGGEAFALVFRGGRAALNQDTYVIVHPALGTFELFLVPGGSDQNGAHECSATVNRLSATDFANMSAPSRSATSAPRNLPQTSNSTVSHPSTSTVTTATPVTPPAISQPNEAPATTNVVPASAPPARHRKPARKRVDPKTPFIN